MTDEEARTVCTIMMDADGGCPYCASSLIQQFVTAYPDKRDIAQSCWEKDYEGDVMER